LDAESFINQMESQSGVTFNEAQVALARQWIGQDPETNQTTVTLSLPGTTSEPGLALGEKTKEESKTVTIPIPESEEAARDIVERFERGAENLRPDEAVSDSVAQHMLNDRTGLQDEQWLGTPEEELDA
jgi:phospholipase D1/2